MIPSSVGIYVCTEPQDMRRSFDGLARAVRDEMNDDPRSGALYCFVNKRANRLKVMWWDKTGYCMLYKRMHEAIVVLPVGARGEPTVRIDARRLAAIVAGEPKIRRTRKPV